MYVPSFLSFHGDFLLYQNYLYDVILSLTTIETSILCSLCNQLLGGAGVLFLLNTLINIFDRIDLKIASVRLFLSSCYSSDEFMPYQEPLSASSIQNTPVFISSA